MISKEQCLKILKTLSAVEGILRSHSKTGIIPDYIWDEITDIAETLSQEILGPVDTPMSLPEPVAWLHTSKFGSVQAFTAEPPPGLKAQSQPLYTEQQVRALLAEVIAVPLYTIQVKSES